MAPQTSVAQPAMNNPKPKNGIKVLRIVLTVALAIAAVLFVFYAAIATLFLYYKHDDMSYKSDPDCANKLDYEYDRKAHGQEERRYRESLPKDMDPKERERQVTEHMYQRERTWHEGFLECLEKYRGISPENDDTFYDGLDRIDKIYEQKLHYLETDGVREQN